MIKIEINNEEVVCDKNLSIKEEMLSTSSTILKNCYPKSWNDDYNYTRFWFPKDYSKCKITDIDYYPPIIGTRVSGTDLNINYNNELKWDLEELQGNTIQNGTPTPDSPVEIQTVTGEQNVNVCGKNLFDKENTQWYRNNGSAFSNTTNTSTTRIRTNSFGIKGGETYTLSGIPNGITPLIVSQYEEYNGNRTSYVDFSNNTFTLSQNTKYINLMFSGENFTSETNTLMANANIQLEKGSTATEYEEYIGQDYKINLGKNLYDISTADYTYKCTLENEVYTTDTLTSSGRSINFGYRANNNYTIKDGERYYFSADIRLVSGNASVTNALRFNVSGLTNTTISNPTYSNTFQRYVFSSVNNTGSDLVTGRLVFQPTSTNLDNAVFEIKNVMISKSNNSEYVPYITPIELNKIGNYKDYIKKSKGQQLFDKSTITIGYINANGSITTNQSYATSDFIEIDSSLTYSKTATNSPRVKLYDKDKNLISTESISDISSFGNAGTYTIPYENAKYIRFTTRADQEPSSINKVMFVVGDTIPTEYEPYLPKGTWYVEKQIGKVVLNGSENWQRNDANEVFLLSNFVNYLTNGFIPYSNYYTGQNITQYSQLNNNSIAFLQSTQNNRLLIKNTNISNDTNFKTWLSTHNTTVYYVLATPTYTEITDTNLIEQLNSIELLNGLNNISVSSAYLPASLQIYYNYREESTTEDLLFCGVVKNTGNINLNPREPHYCDLQVLDFKTFLSEGETLNFVINNKTITQAIQQVINAISDYGFVLGNIQILSPDDIINAYSTLNKTAYDVFQYIADVTQSRWTTRMIDENTVAIDFYDPSLMPQGLEIESTNEFYCQNHIMDISFNYSTMDYRNKQIMTSDEVFSNITQTETLIADGYTKSFMCQNKIGYITKITVNGVNQTVATKSEEDLGVSADFTYTPGEMTFNSKNTLASGSVIVITYYAIVKGREIILNSSEISRITDQIDRKGVISRYENRNDTLSSNELIKIGQSYIKYKGSAEITLKVVSENNLFNVGEIVNYDSPLEELSTEYMVKSKQIDMYLTANEIVYTYELTSNFNSENAVNYFDNQRAKNQGNLGQGETITRNIDIESTALIQFYDYSIEEVQIGTNTTLDFQLDSVL